MNVSDAPPGPPQGRARPLARARATTATLVIRREDHLGDRLGLIFAQSASDPDVIIERLREYLGPRVSVLRAEVGSERMEVEVGGRHLAEEAARLAEAAERLRRNGASRSAAAHFKEALALDPLNLTALRGLGTLLAAGTEHTAALQMLCKAREVGGDGPEVLHELGRAAAAMGRVATALVYLERACELAPDNLAIRRTLAEMGRKPRSTARLRERAALSQRNRENEG